MLYKNVKWADVKGNCRNWIVSITIKCIKVSFFTKAVIRKSCPVSNTKCHGDCICHSASRLYGRHFSQFGKSRWVGFSDEMLACCICRYSGVPHWSAGTKRASLWLARLHHILVSTIWMTRMNISMMFVD